MSTSINSRDLVLSTLKVLTFATLSIVKSKGNEHDVTILAPPTSYLYSDDHQRRCIVLIEGKMRLYAYALIH